MALRFWASFFRTLLALLLLLLVPLAPGSGEPGAADDLCPLELLLVLQLGGEKEVQSRPLPAPTPHLPQPTPHAHCFHAQSGVWNFSRAASLRSSSVSGTSGMARLALACSARPLLLLLHGFLLFLCRGGSGRRGTALSHSAVSESLRPY